MTEQPSLAGLRQDGTSTRGHAAVHASERRGSRQADQPAARRRVTRRHSGRAGCDSARSSGLSVPLSTRSMPPSSRASGRNRAGIPMLIGNHARFAWTFAHVRTGLVAADACEQRQQSARRDAPATRCTAACGSRSGILRVAGKGRGRCPLGIKQRALLDSRRGAGRRRPPREPRERLPDRRASRLKGWIRRTWS